MFRFLGRNWKTVGVVLIVFFVIKGCFNGDLREPINMAKAEVKKQLEMSEKQGQIKDYDIGHVQVIEDSDNANSHSDERTVRLRVLFDVTFPDGKDKTQQFRDYLFYKSKDNDKWVYERYAN